MRKYRVTSWLRSHRPEIIIVMLAILLRAGLFLASLNYAGQDHILGAASDTDGYIAMAHDLINGTDTNLKGFFCQGPGYPVFLAVNMLLYGDHAVLIVTIQIILSVSACLLIYRLAMTLTRSRSIATLAGILSATSYTHIGLSCMLLSDCLYAFLFLLSVSTFLSAQITGKWSQFMLSGLVTGVAILTRPIGQFWPIMMLAIGATACFMPLNNLPGAVAMGWRSRMYKTVASIGIVALLVVPWVVRNGIVHGIPVLAFTSIGGPANVAATTIGVARGESRATIIQEWIQTHLRENGKMSITVEEQYYLYVEKTKNVLRLHPWGMVRNYAKMTWENLNEIGYYFQMLLPQVQEVAFSAGKWIKKYKLNYLNFVLSMAGFLLLARRRNFMALLVLASVYFYSSVTIGSYMLQGSRYFLPGLIAVHILSSITILAMAGWSIKGARYLRTTILRLAGCDAG